MTRAETEAEIKRLRREAILEGVNAIEAKGMGLKGLAIGCALHADQLAENADRLAASPEPSE